MNIQIDDKTRITSDAHNYVIEQRHGTRKDGSQEWRGIKFYTTIAGLVNGLHQERLRKSTARSLQELAEAVKSSNEWLATIADQLAPSTSTHAISQGGQND